MRGNPPGRKKMKRENGFFDSRFEPLIKVCGITCLRDALASVEAGANALGFNFYPPSPRFLDLGKAEKIVSGLPHGILTFAVVVRGYALSAGASHEDVDDAGKRLMDIDGYGIPEWFDIVQVHGVDDAAQVPGSRRPLLIAVSPESAPQFNEYDIIIDTSWGEGKLADWEKTSQLKRPYILSGGLNPGNVEEALERLNPAGIDVCSGVESSPGRKDPEKLQNFLEKANAFYRGKQGEIT